MRPNMPTLGPSPKKSSLPGVLLVALLVGGLAGGIYWIRKRTDPAVEDVAAVAAQSAPDAGSAAAIAAAPVKTESPQDDLLQKSGLKFAAASINGPLETAIVDQVGNEVGPALTQVVTRALVWWIAVPGDLLRGDRIEILYEERNNDEPAVHAVRFESNKMGKTFTAFRYQAESDTFPRMYTADGAELEMRLSPTPIDEYEQVTSLLRDGRRHKGVDFKAPVGIPVKATFDGVVTRRNWNFRGNGNCIELTEHGGRRKALYLHLDELPSDVKVGMRVQAGQVIAKSGNSGRSFAPHLHYQLMSQSDRVLDPFDQHKTWRKSLKSEARAGFDAEARRLETLMSSKVAR